MEGYIYFSACLLDTNTNGVHTTVATAIQISCTTTPCQPCPMNALKITGTPNGQSTVLHGKKPIFVKNRAIPVEIAELKINGIAKVGFNTSGSPNTTGSLIPHMLGKIPNFAIILWSSLLEKIKIAINKDKIIPAPPVTIKFNQKPYVIG